MQNNIKNFISSFEKIKQVENSFEYWSARDLQNLLGYVQWRNFEGAIEKAIIS